METLCGGGKKQVFSLWQQGSNVGLQKDAYHTLCHKKHAFENVFKSQEPISIGNVPQSASKSLICLSQNDKTIYSQRLLR